MSQEINFSKHASCDVPGPDLLLAVRATCAKGFPELPNPWIWYQQNCPRCHTAVLLPIP
jgi:hypothetical protein